MVIRPDVLPAREERLPYVAGAVLASDISGLLAHNGQPIRAPNVDVDAWADQELSLVEQHHLEKTAEGLTVSEIWKDWKSLSGETTSFANHTLVRGRLFAKFNAATAPQLVSIAASAGRIACPSLVLKKPYEFSAQDITIVGLFGSGLSGKDVGKVFGVSEIGHLTGDLFRALQERVSSTESVPKQRSAAWIVHTARRLGVITHTPDSIEHLPIPTLTEGLARVMHPSYDFRQPPPDSPITIAAAPYLPQEGQ